MSPAALAAPGGMDVGAIELTVAISSLRDLRASPLAPYDAVYLGNIYCREYEGNLLERPAELTQAIGELQARGQRAYLATYAAPRAAALPAIRRALAAAQAAGAEAVEVHSLGVLGIVRDEFPGLRPHVGGFANVYTPAGARALAARGAGRVLPSQELGLEELRNLAEEGGLPLEVVIHGKQPLGVSETCMLLEHEAGWGAGCPTLCQLDVFLDKDDWSLKSVGKGVLGGRDLCLLDHLPRLLAAGPRAFRIEAVSESPDYREAVGQVYREALIRLAGGDVRLDPAWWSVLRAHAPRGLANGFLFGQRGLAYLDAADLPSSGGPAWRPGPLLAQERGERGKPDRGQGQEHEPG